MYGTIVRHGSDDHYNRSNKIQITKMDCIITRTKIHVRSTPIKAEDYLRKEVLKKSTLQAADKFNELADHYTKP